MAYPSSLDSFSSKTDGVSDVIAADYNGHSSSIVAIETELGITPKASFADVSARLDRLTTIGVEMYRASTSTTDTASGGRTMTGYDNTRYSDTGFTAVQGTGLITVPNAGYYAVESHAHFSANYTGGFTQLTINDGTNDIILGPQIQASSTSPHLDLSCSGVIKLSAGAVIRSRIFTGTSTSLTGNATGNLYYFRVVGL